MAHLETELPSWPWPDLNPFFPQTATSCWLTHRAHGAFPLSTVPTASASSQATAAPRSCRKPAAAASSMVQRPVSQPCRGCTRLWRAIRSTALKYASTERMVRGSSLPCRPAQTPDLTQSPLETVETWLLVPTLPQADRVTLSVSLTLSEPWFSHQEGEGDG